MNRRIFLGAAPALVILAGPATARETSKKGAKDTVSPPEDLMREHGVLDRVLLIYEAGLRRLAAGEDFAPSVVEQAAEGVRDFLHEAYHKSRRETRSPRLPPPAPRAGLAPTAKPTPAPPPTGGPGAVSSSASNTLKRARASASSTSCARPWPSARGSPTSRSSKSA